MNKQFILNFLKGSASTSVGTVSSIVFHFLSIMIMTRYVSREEFGIYVLILVIVHCLKILGGLGLDLTMVKFISGEKEEGENPFLTIVLTRTILLFILSIIVYSAGHLLLPLLDERINEYLLYIPVMFSLASIRELFFHLLQGLNLFKKYALVQVLSAILKFGLVLAYLSLDQLSLQSLIYVEALTLLLSFILQLFVTPVKELISFRNTRRTFKRVIQFSIPLYFNNILTFIYGRVNIFMIGIFLNPASIALFEVAGKIPEGFDRLFKSFIVVYFPNFSKLLAQGHKKDAQKMMNQSLILFSIGIVFVVLVSFLFQKEIILLIFSENYVDASWAFSLLMFGFFLQAIYNIMGYSLVSAGYPSVPVKVNIVSSIINITGSLIMIPIWGFMGAVYSLLIMDIVSQFLHFLYLLKAEIYADFRQYLKPVFILGVTVGAYLLIGQEAIPVRFLFLGLYILLCLIFMKELRKTLSFAVNMLKNSRLQTKAI